MPIPVYKKKWRGIPIFKGAGIYTITNRVNGKVYVGSASCIRGRLSAHRSYLRNRVADNEYLQRSWDKYGEEAFDFDTVEPIFAPTPELLLQREDAWMISLNTRDRKYGFNINNPTLPPMAGKRHTEEARRKMSEAQTGRDREKYREASLLGAQAMREKGHSAESRAKISAGNKGRPKTPEEIAKMVATRKANGTYKKGYTQDPEHVAKRVAARKATMDAKGPQEVSQETRQKLSATHWSKTEKADEVRAKAVARQTGKYHTIESRERMSEARRKWWEEKKRLELLRLMKEQGG